VLDYYCRPGLALLRGLDRAPATWTVHSAVGTQGKLTSGPTEKIEIAWYGSPSGFR